MYNKFIKTKLLRHLVVWSLISTLTGCQQMVDKTMLAHVDESHTIPHGQPLTSPDEPIFHDNCLGQCPTGADKSNIVVNHDAIILSSNVTTKFADWVAYKITVKYLEGPERKRNWAKDPVLDPAFTFIPKDYQGMSAAPFNFDRGHQAPLAAFRGHQKWFVVNYLSNITPQRKYLNQGSWNILESKERRMAKEHGDVYVLTGPYYDTRQPIEGPAQRRIDYIIPSGYWKIISVHNDNGRESLGFIFPQDTPRQANYCDYIRSINDIEILTHLYFFNDNMPVQEHNLKDKIGCGTKN